jgi:hypothetical protein
MPLKVESLSNHARTVLLARLAYTLTICARDTYEAETDRVVKPELLRAYNELLHRVTGATMNHILGSDGDGDGYSLKAILEMLHAFGERNKRVAEMQWALEQAEKSL